MFKNAVKEDPKDTRTWLRMAEVYVRLGAERQGHRGLPEDRRPLRRAGLLPAGGRRLQEHHQALPRFRRGPASSSPTCSGSSACSRMQCSNLSRRRRSIKRRTTVPEALCRAQSRSSTSTPSNPTHASATPSWPRRPEPSRRPSRNSPRQPGWSRRRAAPMSSCAWPSECCTTSRTTTTWRWRWPAKYLDSNNARAALGHSKRVFEAKQRDPAVLDLLARAFDQLGQPHKTLPGTQGAGAGLRRIRPHQRAQSGRPARAVHGSKRRRNA